MIGGASAGPVALVGLGALGGSLARALAALPEPPVRIGTALDSEDVASALEARAIERAFEGVVQVAREARWLVVATPVGAEAEVLSAAAAALPEGARVIDLGSLQRPALEAARAAGLGARFVACHPMAGSEASGFGASRADLFVGKRVWLSADPGVATPLRDAVEALWASVGAEPGWIEPDAHDALMIAASHLPQVVSNALARVLARVGLAPSDLGPGGLDMTRLASSDPGMWRDVLVHSGADLAPLLDALSAELGDLRDHLAQGDMDPVERLMEATRVWRAE